MKRTQIAALILVLVVIGAVVAMKANKTQGSNTVPEGATCPTVPSKSNTGSTPAPAPTAKGSVASLPRLLDLGSTTCIPCKELAPILDQLKVELRGKVDVEFIDITKDPKAADTYAISVIPTQVFFDGQGKELFRHEGFIPKADILAKLHELKMLPKE